jgi:hypothetical protein
MKKANAKTARKANERTNVSSSDEDDSPKDQHNVECLVEDIPKVKRGRYLAMTNPLQAPKKKLSRIRLLILDKRMRHQMSLLYCPKYLYLLELNQ